MPLTPLEEWALGRSQSGDFTLDDGPTPLERWATGQAATLGARHRDMSQLGAELRAAGAEPGIGSSGVGSDRGHGPSGGDLLGAVVGSPVAIALHSDPIRLRRAAAAPSAEDGENLGARAGLPGLGYVKPPDSSYLDVLKAAAGSSFGVQLAGLMEEGRDVQKRDAEELSRITGVPLSSLGADNGVPEGLTDAMAELSRDQRERYLEAHPDNLHAALALGGELGVNILPMAAGAPAALRGGMELGKAPTLAKAVGGAVRGLRAGAVGGAALGYLGSYGAPLADRVDAAASNAALGGLVGIVGGAAARPELAVERGAPNEWGYRDYTARLGGQEIGSATVRPEPGGGFTLSHLSSPDLVSEATPPEVFGAAPAGHEAVLRSAAADLGQYRGTASPLGEAGGAALAGVREAAPEIFGPRALEANAIDLRAPEPLPAPQVSDLPSIRATLGRFKLPGWLTAETPAPSLRGHAEDLSRRSGAETPTIEQRQASPPPVDAPTEGTQLAAAYAEQRRQVATLPPETQPAVAQQVDAAFHEAASAAGAKSDEIAAGLADLTEPAIAPQVQAPPERPSVAPADSSPALGINRLGQDEKLYVARSGGRDVGSLIAVGDDQGGFRVKHVFVDEAARGQQVPEDLYRAAHQDLGPYLGSTDFLGRRTPAGDAMHARLQQTAPEIFSPPTTPTVPAGFKPSEAGFLKLSPGAPPPPSVPFDAVKGDPTPTPLSGRERLQRFADRAYAELINKQQAPVSLLRRAGLGQEAETLDNLIARSRGAAEIAQGPILRGTRIFDPATGDSFLTGPSARSFLMGLDAGTTADLDNYLLATRHLELLGRRVAADHQYVTLQAQRAAQLAAQKQAINASAQAIRTSSAPAAARNELVARAREKIPAVEKPPDLAIEIDPRGNQLAYDELARLNSKWGADVDPVTGQHQTRTLGALANQYYDWMDRAAIQPLIQVGFVGPDQAAALRRDGKTYAPLMRVGMEIDAAMKDDPVVLVGGTSREPLKRIHGGLSPDNPVASPLESSMMKVQQIHRWVERQRIRNYLADVADAHPQDLPEIAPGRRTGAGADTRTFTVWRDGKPFEYSAPADVMQALERLTPKQASMAIQFGRFGASLLRAGATLDPSFLVRNPFRDQSDAATYSKYGYVPFWDLAKGLFFMTPEGQKAFPHFAEWRDNGGATSTYLSVDRAQAQADLYNATRPPGAVSAMQNFFHEYRKALTSNGPLGVLYPLHELSGALEAGTRVGVYARARKSGASMLDAIADSRQATTDFGRSGSWGQEWNGMVAFFNADLQDMDKFVRVFRKRPAATAIKALAYVAIPALLNYAKNYNDPQYAGLPEWEKLAFLHPAKREDGTFWRQPRPLGPLNLVFSYGLHKGLDAVNDKDPNALQHFLHGLSVLTPAHYVWDPGTGFGGINPVDMVPTVARPLLEQGMGEGGWDSYRQQPIVPSSLAGQHGVRPPEQYNENTSTSLKALGAAIDQSPIRMQYLVRSYLGGVGTLAMQGADAVAGSMGLPQPPPLPLSAGKIPLVRGFVSQPAVGFGSQPVQDLYDLGKMADEALNSFEKAAAEGRGAAAIKILREHPEAGVQKDLQAARIAVGEVRKQRTAVRMATGLTPEERAQRLFTIDQGVTAMAARTMENITRALMAARKAKRPIQPLPIDEEGDE